MLQLTISDPDVLAKICHALSTKLRLSILQALETETLSCLELSQLLGYPLSTISTNIKVLETAGLVITELQPAKNGSKKLCSLVYLDVFIHLASSPLIPKDTKLYRRQVLIGNYSDFQVSPSCGFICTTVPENVDAHLDDPYFFLDPSRIDAQLLWFRKGYVEYKVPVYYPLDLEPQAIAFSLEICSEAPGFNNKFKSDITMWINGVEVGTWLSLGDYGDRMGLYTPKAWELGSTQYGILTEWKVNSEGTFINSEQISDVTVKDLDLLREKCVVMRIGVKETSKHVGGINIFGEKFGDYPQNIEMTIHY